MTHRTIRDWLAVAAAALALTLPLPASAVVLVGGQGAAVTVDPSALDAPSQRRLDVGHDSGLPIPGARLAPGERVRLVPPGQKPGQKLTLTPPGSAKAPLLPPGNGRVVLIPPPGVQPLLTAPKRTATVAPAKKAPSAAEIEAEVTARTAPLPMPKPAPAPAPQVAAPPAVEPPAVEPPAADPMPIAPAEPVAPPVAAAPAAPEPPVATPVPPPAPETPRVAAVAPPAIPAAPSLPPAATPVATLALAFDPDDARLNEAHRALLKDVVVRLSNEPEATVQLLAYAQGENRSKARRLSLSRALAVRSYLLSQDVRNTRIEVRALGDQLPAGGKPDRVDVVIEKP